MRAEKKYLIAEVETHLKKSDYVILANFTGATVADVADLRTRLAAEKAEFHVVKNSSLRVAAKALGPARHRGRPDRPDGHRRRRQEFARRRQDPQAVLQGKAEDRRSRPASSARKLITAKQVEQLADMPSLEALRAQLLGLLNQPAGAFVRVINAVPQGVVNVLQAKVRAAAP